MILVFPVSIVAAAPLGICVWLWPVRTMGFVAAVYVAYFFVLGALLAATIIVEDGLYGVCGGLAVCVLHFLLGAVEARGDLYGRLVERYRSPAAIASDVTLVSVAVFSVVVLSVGVSVWSGIVATVGALVGNTGCLYTRVLSL